MGRKLDKITSQEYVRRVLTGLLGTMVAKSTSVSNLLPLAPADGDERQCC